VDLAEDFTDTTDAGSVSLIYSFCRRRPLPGGAAAGLGRTKHS